MTMLVRIREESNYDVGVVGYYRVRDIPQTAASVLTVDFSNSSRESQSPLGEWRWSEIMISLIAYFEFNSG